MSSQARWIKSKAEGSLNPVQVEKALSEITSVWDGSLPDFLHDFPLGEEALIHLLAVSQICAERLQRDPGLLRWLARPEISMSDRGPRRMLAELHGNSESIAAENFRPLRLWKAREMTRIALREVAEASALEDTTAELSCLAGVCLATIYEECDTRLRARAGAPGTEFTILGMGKLGGRELNHSSDIDLIFLYGEEGQGRFTNHEWHNRLAEQIVKSFSGGEPNLFRIDLRLRPEGAAGPLARSLESMENYYAGFGETWERLALIKARGVAGSRELAYEFLRQHQPFIYPKSPTPDVLEEISAIKRRIERELVGRENIERDVKLGASGWDGGRHRKPGDLSRWKSGGQVAGGSGERDGRFSCRAPHAPRAAQSASAFISLARARGRSGHGAQSVHPLRGSVRPAQHALRVARGESKASRAAHENFRCEPLRRRFAHSSAAVARRDHPRRRARPRGFCRATFETTRGARGQRDFARS